jgi:hypothetical protein
MPALCFYLCSLPKKRKLLSVNICAKNQIKRRHPGGSLLAWVPEKKMKKRGMAKNYAGNEI